MCTAITLKSKHNYFGRTLDVESDYKTQVVICPRNYGLGKNLVNHNAIIGMAMVMDNYPLFFDATNEHGLSMAGLNFPKNAVYFDKTLDKMDLAPYELIPFILGKCKSTLQAKNLFNKINITNDTFKNIPNTPLHWIISDRISSITVEQTKDGLKVFDNKVGVLTNNPTFDWHMTNLVNYLNITNSEPTNRMLKGITLNAFCKGMGAIGLPGDDSSPSRFVRVAFAKNRAETFQTENQNVCQFFHILGNVSQTSGLSRAGDSYERTLYTSCINTNLGIYYYTTYFNPTITAIDMHKADLDGTQLVVYPVDYNTNINTL